MPNRSALRVAGYPGNFRTHRWMLFVDGENLSIRAKDLAKSANLDLIPGPWHLPDAFVWFPRIEATKDLYEDPAHLEATAVRAYYYTSLVGDDTKLDHVREQLWDLGFTPAVFKKTRPEQKAKGVDIALARDLLLHAANDHYDTAVLVAGDGDYVPLVDAVKQLGKRAYVAFFGAHGLSPELRRASDSFFDLTNEFKTTWLEQRRLAQNVAGRT